MRKLLFSAMLLSLFITPAFAAPQRDHEDHQDNGDDHHDRGDRDHGDRDDHHDNGRHKGWYKHHGDDRDDHGDWDYDHDRIQPGRRYPHGRYEDVRRVFIARSFDVHTRRAILSDGSTWVIASYDVNRCRDWDWDRDEVVVYDDDTHPGWYLLYDSSRSRYIHVEFFGR